MTINLSIRNYALTIAGLNCTDGLVSFTGSDSQIDQSGLITFTGNLVLKRPMGAFESLDDRKNARWSQGNAINVLIADQSATLRTPPRCGGLFILDSSYSPKERQLTIHFGDWLSLLKGKEPIGNASKICLGTSTSKSGLVGTLLTAAGVPLNQQNIAIPGGISAPAPRLVEGSYLDQAGQVAASSGYFLYVDSVGVVRSRAIDAATAMAVIRLNGNQIVASERVAGQVPASKLTIQAQCSVVTPARDSYSAYSEQKGPALIAGVTTGASSASTNEIVLKRTEKSDSFNRGAKTRNVTSKIDQCLGVLFPDDDQFAGSTALETAEFRRETHTYETHAPLTGVSGSAACQQGNQGRLLRTVIELYKMRGVVLRDVLASYPEEQVGDKTAIMLAEVEETSYQYDLGQNFQATIGSPDDWTPTPLGDGPQITTRKYQTVGSLCANEFAFGSTLTEPTRLVEYDRQIQRWVENHQGEWQKSTQQYQALVLANSSTAEALRAQIEDPQALVDALIALSVGDDDEEFSNGGQTQASAPTTYPAAFTTTEKSVTGSAKFPANAATPYRQPEQSLSFAYLNSTSRTAAQGDADRLAKLWAPLLWGRYKAVSYTTDLADDWFDYVPLARVDAVEESDRFAYLGDGFALAIAGKRCAVSIDGLYLGYLGADYIDSGTAPPIDVDPVGNYVAGAVSLVPPEVYRPYVRVTGLAAAQAQRATLSYRLYSLSPIVQSLQAAQGSAARLKAHLSLSLQAAQGSATQLQPKSRFALQAAQGSASQLITVVTPTDADYPNVSLLLHGESLIDHSPAPKTVSAVGNAQISTAQAIFGGSAILLDGIGDRLSVSTSTDFDFGNGDFTLELFVRFNTFRANNALITNQDLNFGIGGFSFYAQVGVLLFDYRDTINNGSQFLGAYVPSSVDGGELITDTWYHLAVSRLGANLRFYVNGILAGSPAFVGNGIATSTQSLLIGSRGTSTSRDLNGYLDEIRITKGVGRTITVPTQAYPDA